MPMRDWDWVEWLIYSAFAVLGIGLALVIIGFVVEARASAKFQAHCPGKSYQTLVMELGPPTEREAFPDGTEVICWKKYHEATTTFVQSGKVAVPIHNPAYISGWKAIMRDGVCRRMETL